jgi:hypothetical protein
MVLKSNIYEGFPLIQILVEEVNATVTQAQHLSSLQLSSAAQKHIVSAVAKTLTIVFQRVCKVV